MRFYNTVSQHIEMLIDGLSSDLGVELVDFNQIDVSKGYSQFAYVIGDCIPCGFNETGQQKLQVEFEIRLMIPTSTDNGLTPQLYALDVSNKIAGLVMMKGYGFDGQSEQPELEINAAMPNSNHEKKHSYIVRSLVFTQFVYTGQSQVGCDVIWTGHEVEIEYPFN